MKLTDLDSQFDDINETHDRQMSDILGNFDFGSSIDQKQHLVERGLHLLEATIMFMDELENQIGNDGAIMLERKLCNSIKQRSHEKFERFARKTINEHKE